MKKTLEWRHLAPTCPDTVPCTPCVDTDPFVIYNCPAIYFCGDADVFATEMYEGTIIGFMLLVKCIMLEIALIHRFFRFTPSAVITCLNPKYFTSHYKCLKSFYFFPKKVHKPFQKS